MLIQILKRVQTETGTNWLNFIKPLRKLLDQYQCIQSLAITNRILHICMTKKSLTFISFNLNSFSYPPNNVDKQLSLKWLFDVTITEWSSWFSSEETHHSLRRGGFYTLLLKPGYRLIGLNNNMCLTSNLYVLWSIRRIKIPLTEEYVFNTDGWFTTTKIRTTNYNGLFKYYTKLKRKANAYI